MATSTKIEIRDALKAPIKESEKKRDAANDAVSNDTEILNSLKEELRTTEDRIDKSNNTLKDLAEVKKSFNEVNRLGNFALTLGADVDGASVAQSITDAAKSVKTALGSLEKAYPEAMAMNARVVKIDAEDDKDSTKDIVATYKDTTIAAADLTETWKNTSTKLAVENSSFLKLKVDGGKASITDLMTNIEALGQDVDSTIADRQALLEQDTTTASELKAKIDELNIEIEKNTMVSKTSAGIIEKNKKIDDANNQNSNKEVQETSKDSGKSKGYSKAKKQ